LAIADRGLRVQIRNPQSEIRNPKWTGAALALALGLALAASGVKAEGLEDEARAIARELQCPVCQGLSVADSPSELASQMRGIIRERLQGGEGRDAVLAYFVDRYGETILLTPPRSGFTAVAWVAPYGALLAGIGMLVWTVRRRSAARTAEPPADPGLEPYLEAVDQTFNRVRDESLR
jgi:cytochrome c-type biogenesis protein CcmH